MLRSMPRLCWAILASFVLSVVACAIAWKSRWLDQTQIDWLLVGVQNNGPGDIALDPPVTEPTAVEPVAQTRTTTLENLFISQENVSAAVSSTFPAPSATSVVIQNLVDNVNQVGLEACMAGRDENKQNFCNKAPSVALASAPPYEAGTEVTVRICSPFNTQDSSYRFKVQGKTQDGKEVSLSVWPQAEDQTRGSFIARFVAPPSGSYTIEVRPLIFTVVGGLSQKCLSPGFNFEGYNMGRKECRQQAVCTADVHTVIDLKIMPSATGLPPRPACRMGAEPHDGMWLDGQWRPHSCNLVQSWQSSLSNALVGRNLKRFLFAGDSLMLHFCQALRATFCSKGPKCRGVQYSAHAKPYQYRLTFETADGVNMTCNCGVLETVRKHLQSGDNFDVVVLNRAQHLAMFGCPPNKQQEYLENELAAWANITEPSLGRLVYATAGTPMEWKMPGKKWKPRYCNLNSFLLDLYYKNEIKTAPKHGFELFDTHSITAARDDWHKSGDAVHYVPGADSILVHMFFQLLLEQSPPKAA